MKKFFLIITCLFLLNPSYSQNGFHKFSVYCNTGYSIYNNFDFKPSNSSFGEVGIKLYLLKGLSVGLNGNAVYFRKSINLSDFVVSYYTQFNAGGAFLMYENEIIPNWYLGIGANFSFGIFSGMIYDNYGIQLKQTSGILETSLNRTVRNHVGFVNIRRKITNHFDIQLGVSYNDFRSNYLDMYKSSEQVDNYMVGYGGLLYNFGNSNGENIKINSRKISCPKVKY
jgi:hypothetical protein